MKKLIFLVFSILLISFSYSDAQVSTNQSAQLKGDTLKAKLRKAQSLVRQGNSEEASKIYLSLMESYPDSKEAVQGWIIANAYKAPSGPEFIQNALDQFEKQYPDNIAIVFWKAFLQASTGKNELALENFDKLTKIQPDSAVNHIGKGQVLYTMGRYIEAYEAFERATTVEPKRQDVWGMKALALAKLGRFDEAISSINKGLDLAPNDPVSTYNRACIYCLKGDRVNALADLKKAISINPSFKKQAIIDEDFKSLYNDEEFKKLTF